MREDLVHHVSRKRKMEAIFHKQNLSLCCKGSRHYVFLPVYNGSWRRIKEHVKLLLKSNESQRDDSVVGCLPPSLLTRVQSPEPNGTKRDSVKLSSDHHMHAMVHMLALARARAHTHTHEEFL